MLKMLTGKLDKITLREKTIVSIPKAGEAGSWKHNALPLSFLILAWFLYMSASGSWHLFYENWFMPLTMIFGSFIAGASAEGGGAVAFPAMTLAYGIDPSTARNFSLAIQSVGMTAAAIIIWRNKFRIELRYLWPASLGGAIGITIGTFYLTPVIPPAFVKMLFVSFWLSFGFILFYINHIDKRTVVQGIPALSGIEIFSLVIVGIAGGNLSALLGSGLDIVSFAYITVRYHLSEKVATPTSVIIMAINSAVGFLLHQFVLADFGREEFNYWLVCIPVVLIGAPLGACFINQRTRNFVNWFLYLIILAQFIGALLIIKPRGPLMIFTIAVFVGGLVFFYVFTRLSMITRES